METHLKSNNNFFHCFLIFFWVSISFSQAQSKTAPIQEGSYVPLYGSTEDKSVTVPGFLLDVYPVTNQEFLAFLKANPAYKRSNIKRLFARESYLSHWKNDLDYGVLLPNAPVTNVSWFAAKKYCECQGKRLPTLDEWEYVAMADRQGKDARTNENYNNYILGWYEKNDTYLKPVGSTFKNYWGVYDMHGLVWEWTFDFNSIFLSGESRKDKDTDKNLFCGSGSINATDLMNYAAFMRYAFRGSLKASYTTKNLGFRCAKDFENK